MLSAATRATRYGAKLLAFHARFLRDDDEENARDLEAILNFT